MAPRTEVRAEDHVSTREILVGGRAIGVELNNRIGEIRVEQSLGLPDVCIMKITYTEREIDREDFKIGDEIEVKFGETDATRRTTVFTGEIVTLAPVFGEGGIELQVWCYDRVHRLTRERKTKTFVQMSDQDVFRKIASEHGLSYSAQGTLQAPTHEHIYQHNETDLEFFNRRAERIGAEFVTEGKKLIVRPRGKGETVTVTYGEDLTGFAPRITATQSVSKATVRAYDPKTKQAIASSATPRMTTRTGLSRDNVSRPFGKSTLRISTEPVASSSEATSLAQAAISKVADNYAMAEGWGKGNSRIRAGVLLTVRRVGQFAGTYRITQVVHEQRGGGTFATRFSTYPATPVHSNGGGSRKPQFGDHVAIGIVTNNNDPEKLGRVKVTFPALDEDNESDWLRVVTPSAGNERGMMMLPVINEEVLVAFEHGLRPVVIGSLFNGKDTPGPIADTKGAFVLISDDRVLQHANKDFEVSTDENMLTVALKNSTTRVKQDRTLEVSGNDKVDVKGNADMTAMNITIKGNGQIKIESSAPVSIKSSATVDISGSVVSVKSNGPLTLKGNPIMLN